MGRKLLLLAVPCVLFANSSGGNDINASAQGIDDAPIGGVLPLAAAAPLIEPVRPAGAVGVKDKGPSVNWPGLLRQSTWFLGIEHAFRWATEPGTRNAKGAPWPGYVKSVRNLHGWSDGDPFYVNYVGHPLMGAVSANIWIQNDRKYSSARFGMNRDYWRSRLRAAGFAWAYSTQFEIGPVSEASIGYIQSRHPQQGLVDHVVTPTLGLGWVVAEDAIDRYLLPALERRVQNLWVRMFARGFLNPSRAMANMMAGRVPFYREGRSIFGDGSIEYSATRPSKVDSELPPDSGPAPFELTATFKRMNFLGPAGERSCSGGGAEAAFRMSPQWQFVVDVNGCGLGGLPTLVSGDALTYLAGPRWTPSDKRFRPYAQFLIGGTKLTAEQIWPEKKALVEAAYREGDERPSRDEYATKQSNHSLAVAAGLGLDMKLGRAAALKLAGLEYNRSWNAPVAGIDYSRGLQLKMGVTLRMGTW